MLPLVKLCLSVTWLSTPERFHMKFWIFKNLCYYRLVDFFTTAAMHSLKSVLSFLLILALISPITPKIISTQKISLCRNPTCFSKRESETQISSVFLQNAFLHLYITCFVASMHEFSNRIQLNQNSYNHVAYVSFIH